MHMPYLFSLFLLPLFALSCTAGKTTSVDEPDRPPNIVFVLADDLGYGDVGAYGQELITTPELDRMAQEGIRFTRHYSGSTVCAPSRSVLMTGRHTGHTFIRSNGLSNIGLADSVTTVAEVMRQAGYVTGMVGKWGLGDLGTSGVPNRQGFDHYYGYLNQILAHNYYPEYLIRNGEREYLDNVVEYLDTSHWTAGLGSRSSVRKEYSHDLMTREAMTFIETNADSSFFLYLPYTIPHNNGEQPREEQFEVPEQGAYADRDWTKPEKDYAAMVTRLDRDIGRIRRQLDSLGIAENTVLIFTSDNGPINRDYVARFNSNGDLRGGKRDLYEGGIRVPLLVVWPGTISPGRESEVVSDFSDWMPTLASIGDYGGVLPQHDGIDLTPTFVGTGEQELREYLYWEFYEKGGKVAVLREPWKAVRLNTEADPGAPLELYDLSTDESETTDVAAGHPEIIEQMEAIMREAHGPSALYPRLKASSPRY